MRVRGLAVSRLRRVVTTRARSIERRSAIDDDTARRFGQDIGPGYSHDGSEIGFLDTVFRVG